MVFVRGSGVAGDIGWLSKWGCAHDNLVAVAVHDNEAKSRTNSDRGRALRLEKSEARLLPAIRREAKGRSVAVHRGDGAPSLSADEEETIVASRRRRRLRRQPGR